LDSPFREIVWRQLGAGTIVPMEPEAAPITVAVRRVRAGSQNNQAAFGQLDSPGGRPVKMSDREPRLSVHANRIEHSGRAA
jgi:hypothetical protein